MQRLNGKAKRLVPQLIRIGATTTGIRTRLAIHLADTFIRPSLVYGAEVITPSARDFKSADTVMNSAARVITGAERGTPMAAVRGELAAGLAASSDLAALRPLIQELLDLVPLALDES